MPLRLVLLLLPVATLPAQLLLDTYEHVIMQIHCSMFRDDIGNMDPLDVIAVQLPLLGDPGTCAAAASALQAAYSKIWANVHDTGTLGDLRAGLQARNLLYEGNAISAMHRVLASGSPTPREAGTATNLLGLLASLLQDVPSLFAAEGYANLLHQALPEPNALIVPDLAELNALRAAPLFVTLALNTLLDRCAPRLRTAHTHATTGNCAVISHRTGHCTALVLIILPHYCACHCLPLPAAARNAWTAHRMFQ